MKKGFNECWRGVVYRRCISSFEEADQLGGLKEECEVLRGSSIIV